MAIVIDGNNTPTAGSAAYGNGSQLAFISTGTAGQVLQSNGDSAPTWVPVSAQAFITQSTGVNAAPGASLPNDCIALI